jgi:hypothetical protein
MLRSIPSADGAAPKATAQSTAFWSPVIGLGAAFAALLEALAASRQYQQLRSRGVRHDHAIREAFGIGLNRPHALRQGVGAIRFAGKM